MECWVNVSAFTSQKCKSIAYKIVVWWFIYLKVKGYTLNVDI